MARYLGKGQMMASHVTNVNLTDMQFVFLYPPPSFAVVCGIWCWTNFGASCTI